MPRRGRCAETLLGNPRLSRPQWAPGMLLIAAESHLALPGGDPLKAETCYRQLIDRFPKSSEAAQAYYKLGEIALRQKKYDDAMGRYKQCLEQFPQSDFAARSQYGLAAASFAKGDPNGALAALEKLRAANPEPALAARARYLRGLVLQRQNQLESAAKEFEAFLERQSVRRKRPPRPAMPWRCARSPRSSSTRPRRRWRPCCNRSPIMRRRIGPITSWARPCCARTARTRRRRPSAPWRRNCPAAPWRRKAGSRLAGAMKRPRIGPQPPSRKPPRRPMRRRPTRPVWPRPRRRTSRRSSATNWPTCSSARSSSRRPRPCCRTQLREQPGGSLAGPGEVPRRRVPLPARISSPRRCRSSRGLPTTRWRSTMPWRFIGPAPARQTRRNGRKARSSSRR